MLFSEQFTHRWSFTLFSATVKGLAYYLLVSVGDCQDAHLSCMAWLDATRTRDRTQFFSIDGEPPLLVFID